MSLKKTVTALLSAAGIMILILDGQTALQGAAAGISLCLRTVIPSLFPFLFLCSVLTDSLWGTTFWSGKLLRRLGIPAGADSLLISAILGGYPAGAQAVAAAYQQGKLSRKEASHLLRFCSNAGPAFLFGMTALQFSEKNLVWALWIIQILSALLTGLIFQENVEATVSLPPKQCSISALLIHCVTAMSTICGWILLFRILLDFLSRWFFWRFSPEMQVFLCGILELSNGCCALSGIENESIRFLVCSILLSFGGLCVLMQTASVIGTLSCKPYFIGKIIQMCFSFALSILFLQLRWPALLIAGGLSVLFPVYFINLGRFLHPTGV